MPRKRVRTKAGTFSPRWTFNLREYTGSNRTDSAEKRVSSKTATPREHVALQSPRRTFAGAVSREMLDDHVDRECPTSLLAIDS